MNPTSPCRACLVGADAAEGCFVPTLFPETALLSFQVRPRLLGSPLGQEAALPSPSLPAQWHKRGQLGPSAGPWAGSLGSLGKGFVNSSGPPLQRWLLGSARGGSCPPGSQVPGPGRPLGATRVTFEPLPGTPGGLGPVGPVLALISVLPASVRRLSLLHI